MIFFIPKDYLHQNNNTPWVWFLNASTVQSGADKEVIKPVGLNYQLILYKKPAAHFIISTKCYSIVFFLSTHKKKKSVSIKICIDQQISVWCSFRLLEQKGHKHCKDSKTTILPLLILTSVYCINKLLEIIQLIMQTDQIRVSLTILQWIDHVILT